MPAISRLRSSRWTLRSIGRTPGKAAGWSAGRPSATTGRQFAAVSSKVEPEGFTDDGRVTVDVHQVVHDAGSGELISDSRVRHRYRLEDGLVVRMDVLEPPDR
jgi:hypothetical protein